MNKGNVSVWLACNLVHYVVLFPDGQMMHQLEGFLDLIFNNCAGRFSTKFDLRSLKCR